MIEWIKIIKKRLRKINPIQKINVREFLMGNFIFTPSMGMIHQIEYDLR